MLKVSDKKPWIHKKSNHMNLLKNNNRNQTITETTNDNSNQKYSRKSTIQNKQNVVIHTLSLTAGLCKLVLSMITEKLST